MIRKIAFGLCILLSWVTHTVADVGLHPLWSRITLGDIVGGIAILLSLKVMLAQLLSLKEIDPIFIATVGMILFFLLPSYFSLSPQATLVECLVLGYLVLLSWGIALTFRDSLLTQLLPLLMIVIIISTCVGIYDLVATQYHFNRVFPEFKNYPGVMISGFRNSGQAGSYIMILLTILIPLKFSKLYNELTPFTKQLTNVSLVFGIIFIHLTGKYAALIGLAIGLFFFLLLNFRNVKVLKTFSFMIVFMVMFTVVLQFTIPNSFERIAYKFENRIGSVLGIQEASNEKTGNFIVSNFSAGIAAFKERPLIGTGLGAFYKNRHTHEVHSTYVKILGETGLIGLLGYGVFLWVFMLSIRKIIRSNSKKYKSYIIALIPLLIGCFISWCYTYHLRKREFWILIAVISIIVYNYSKENKKIEVVSKLNKNESLNL